MLCLCRSNLFISCNLLCCRICVLSLYHNSVCYCSPSQGVVISQKHWHHKKNRSGLCLKAIWASSVELTTWSPSTVGWVKYVPFMGKSSGLGVGVSKLVWINKSWSSSSRTCWFTPYCYTGVAVGPVSQSSAGWLGLLVSVWGNYRQVGLFSLLGGLWTAWNGCRPIAPNKQNMESFPVWPERPWLPVHSSVSSEVVRGYSLCLGKPQEFKMILERAKASPLAGPLQSDWRDFFESEGAIPKGAEDAWALSPLSTEMRPLCVWDAKRRADVPGALLQPCGLGIQMGKRT